MEVHSVIVRLYLRYGSEKPSAVERKLEIVFAILYSRLVHLQRLNYMLLKNILANCFRLLYDNTLLQITITTTTRERNQNRF